MKKLSGFLSIALLAGSLTYSRPSQAVVAVLHWNVPLMINSVAVISLGAGMALFDRVFMQRTNLWIGELANVGIVFGAGAAVVGFVVLDGEEGQSATLTAIDEKFASELGISAREQAIYNSELEQVNFVVAQVMEEISGLQKPTVNDAKNVWAQYESALAPESMVVLTKLSQKLNRK